MAYARTYNMFRRSDAQEIFCAVCQDQPIPGFVDGISWLYHGTIRDDDEVPAGFLPHVARKASDLNGFYLFYLCKRRAYSSPLGKGATSIRPSLGTMAA
jgi:hypothetical protein